MKLSVLLLALSYFAILGPAIAANTPRWDAKANAASCRIKLSNSGVLHSSPDVLMSKVTHENKLSISLPYFMTKAYSSQFLPLEFSKRDKVNFETFLAYSKNAEIIPTFGPVESWHNLVKVLDGYYISLHFDSPAERKVFLDKIKYFANVYEGDLEVNGTKRYPVALTLEQYEVLQIAYPDLFGIKLIDSSLLNDPVDVRVEASTEAEVIKLSDTVVPSTRGSATYYFKGKTCVGFRNKEGNVFKIGIYRGGLTEDANYASHSEILRRQREALQLVTDVAAMRNPRTEIAIGRKLLDQSLAQLKVAVPKPWTGPIRIDVEGQSRLLQEALDSSSTNLSSIQQLTIELAYHRFNDVHTRLRDYHSQNTILALPDIRKVERGFSNFLKAEANSKLRLKLVAIQNDNQVDSIYLVHGDLIHDNLARLLLGDFSDEKAVRDLVFGTHIELSYDSNGKLNSVKTISHSMIFINGSKQPTRQQSRALEAAFQEAIQQANQ